MRSLRALTIATGLTLLAPGALAEDPPVRSVETPAEAAAKAKPADAEDPGMSTFGGGIWMVDDAQGDDLEEPVPLGTKSDFERKGYEVVGTDEKVELIVDKEGQIYVDRNYQGIVPGLRNTFDPARFARLANRDYVLWVGFQPMASITRIFWQLTDPAPRFEVTRVDDRTLEVFFPGGKIRKKNNRRYVWTNKFNGPIEYIRGKKVRGGSKYTIKLKGSSNHLYRFEAPFLYLDFER